MGIHKDPLEQRKADLRRRLQQKGGGIRYAIDGKLLFKPINYWRKEPNYFRLPRAADVSIISFKAEEGKPLRKGATDEVHITIQEYEYLLEVLRSRVNHIKAQPGANSRINLLEERMFAVDLLCTLDI